MAITLEQVKGMNLKVGTPIEVTVEGRGHLGYFKGVQELADITEEDYNLIWYHTTPLKDSRDVGCIFKRIDKVRKLEYTN